MKRLLISIVLMATAVLAWHIPPTNATITGGVTAVRAGYGLTFSEDPLVDTGTVTWDSTAFKAWYSVAGAGESLNLLVLKATRGRFTDLFADSVSATALEATTIYGDLQGTWKTLDTTDIWSHDLQGTWKTLDTTDLIAHALAGKAATAGTADSTSGGAVRAWSVLNGFTWFGMKCDSGLWAADTTTLTIWAGSRRTVITFSAP